MNEKILVWFDEVSGILNLIFDIVILKLIRVIFFLGYLYIKFDICYVKGFNDID